MFSSASKRGAPYFNHGPSKSPKVSSTISDSNDFNRMKVCVRVRPMAQKEDPSENKSIIDVVDKNLLVFDPFVYENANDQYSYRGKVYKEIGKRPNKNLQFNYDRVFNVHEQNMAVYQETTKELVGSLLSGYNCTVFAYGSTGSGKTHTMLGSTDDPGIIVFTTMDLYKQLDEEDHNNLELSVSYFEIYNEIIYDLLGVTSQPLSLLEDANKGMSVKNLSIHKPKDADHLIQMLEMGNKNRKQHPTDANAESSRSHAIFQISLRRKEFSASQEVSIQVSKMSLIDLAGSERVTVSYNSNRSKGLQREGGNINKSLLALGNCISSLANNKQKGNYIPYRSSKLTLILRDSLGGNCQTLMIATVSPSQVHYEQSHNTLLYAERAKGVQLNVRKNTVTMAIQPRDYKQMLDKLTMEKAKLQQQNEQLRQEVVKYKTQAESFPIEPITSSRDAIEKLHAVKNTIDDLFVQRNQLRKELLDCEHNIKLLDLRLLFKKADNECITTLNADNECEEFKTSSAALSIYKQKLHYTNMKSSLVEKVEENEDKIKRFESDLLDNTDNDIVIRGYFIEHNSTAQAKDVEFAQKHSDEIIESLFDRFEAHRDMISLSHGYNYRSHNILQGQGLLTEEMEERYKNIARKIDCKKSVAWTDNIQSPTIQKKKELVDLSKLPIYMNSTLTPADKRNLVAVRDITPNRLPNKSKTPFRNVNQNQNNHVNANLGNTVTKSKGNSLYVSPSVSSVRFEKENFANQSAYSFRRMPNRNTGYWNSDNNNWNQGSAKQMQRSYSNANNNNYHAPSSSTNFSAPSNNNYAYNPNFRSKYRK